MERQGGLRGLGVVAVLTVAAACAPSSPERGASETAAAGLGDETVDPDGHVYVPIPQVVVDAVAMKDQSALEAELIEPFRSAYETVKAARTKLPHELTEGELAAALRPMMFRDGA